MQRPKLKLPCGRPEKLLQVLSLAALTGLIALTVVRMVTLPARIPTHFGFDGQPDAWGGKGSLLLLPIMGVLLYVGITLLERVPWTYNYAVEITEKNASRQYRLARRMLEWLKLIFMATFLYLQWQITQAAQGLSAGLGVWFLPVCLLALFSVLGIGIYKMIKYK